MWKKKVKKDKASFILIAVILMITSALFSTSQIFTDSINKSIVDYYNNPKFPDVYVFNSSSKEREILKQKANEGKLIKNFQEYDAIYSSMNINKVNNEKFNEDRTLIVSIENIENLNWNIKIIGGNKKLCPEEGEIWISKILADKKDFKLNDYIQIDTAEGHKFKISAIINDSQNGSLANPAKIMYINKKDIELFSNQSRGTFIVFKYAYKAEYVANYLQNNFSNNEYYMEKRYMLLNQLADTGLVSVVMKFASILTLISGIIVVRFTLKNNLMKEVKTIGTYKALGFKASEIKKIYSKSYLFIGVISTFIGVAISIPIAYVLQKNILKYLDCFDCNVRYFAIGGIVILVFNIIIQLFVVLELRKIEKISPIEAISTTSTSKNRKRRWGIKNSTNPVVLAINDILKNKRMSLNLCIIITIYMFITIFFINTDYMFKVSNENANIWLNLHKTSATINTSISSEEMENDIVNHLNNNKLVKNYGYGLYLNGGNYIKYNSEKYGKADLSAIEFFSIYDNLGFETYEGRLPKKYNEINVSIKMLKQTKLKIGDKMTFKVNDKDEDFLIVGSFGSIKYAGLNVRMLNEAMKHYNLNPKYNVIAVQLRNNNYFNEFKKGFENRFKDTCVQPNLGNYNEIMVDMTAMVPTIVSIISIFMIILSALNIICIVSIIILDERRNIGIQKALGFTNKFLKIRIISRITILSAIGIFTSIVIHKLISKTIIELIITSPNAIIFSPANTILYCVIIFLVIVLFAFIGTGTVNRISTIELMEA